MEKTIEWIKEENCSRMVDQLVIPYEYKKVDIKTSSDMYDAIKTMIVRGAPAIGIAGAHGVCLAAIESKEKANFVKCPIIKESPASIECKVKEINLCGVLYGNNKRNCRVSRCFQRNRGSCAE